MPDTARREPAENGNEAVPLGFEPDTDWLEPAVRLTDARSLRAFAHPLRVKLMAALRSYGPLTATQAAAYVGDTPSNCSFHLRSLGSFGVIEQVAGPDNRSRPWRTVPGSVSFDPDDSAESRAAWEAASDVLHASLMDELATWLRQQPDQDEGWRDAWFDSNVTAPMTADELARLRKQFASLLQPFVERRNTRQAAGEPVVREDERPVRAITICFPAPPARRAGPDPDRP